MDPGDLEVEVDRIQCRALLLTLYADGHIPPEVEHCSFLQKDYYTDLLTGFVFPVAAKGKGELTAEEIAANAEECRAARRQELVMWCRAKAFALRIRGEVEQKLGRWIREMTSRWVYTWKKMVVDGVETFFIRARLCLRGFLDWQSAVLATASATAWSLPLPEGGAARTEVSIEA